MIKKYIIRVLMVVCILWLSGCGKKEEDILHLGLNVKIVEIDSAEHIIYVSDMNENIEKVFGEICAIDCSKAIEREKIIYVNYKDENDVRIISFEDLIVGDDIILNIYDKELKDVDDFILVEQIQLATQRMD